MSDQRRYAPRYKVSLFAQIRAIDAKLQESLTPPLAGLVVDISEGGLRIDLDGITEATTQRLAPGVLVAVLFDDRSLKNLGEIQITLAWTNGKANSDGSLKTSIGGQFRQLSVGSRNTLLRFATKNQKTATPPPKPSWPGIAARALLMGALFASGMLVRQCRIDELTQEAESLKGQLEQQHQLANRLADERRSPEVAKVPSAPAVIEPGRIDAGRRAPVVEPGRTPGRTEGVEYTVASPLPGLEMRGLELLSEDFVGVVENTSATAARIKIVLEFGCVEPGRPGQAKCVCVIPELQVSSKTRGEFACSPDSKPLPEPGNVAIKLERLK